MSYTYQKLTGSVTVGGSNGSLFWWENNGGGGTNLSAPLVVVGETWVEDAMGDVATQMTLQSSALGDTITYTATADTATGVVTITASAGTFYLKLTAAEVGKFLTGGDVAQDTRGPHNLGWNVDGAYPAAATTATADFSPSAVWYPNQPKATDDLGAATSFSVESVSMGGKTICYDFSGTSDYLMVRTLEYEMLSQAVRDHWDGQFWQWAKQGVRFKYFDDRSSADHEERVLTGTSLKESNFARNTPSLSRWNTSIAMRLYKP